MAEQKTRPGSADVAAFIAQIEDATKRADSQALIEMMERTTGEKPVLWGTMVGFGAYHYRYASGHAGETFLVGFAPRKAEFSLYLNGCQLPEVASETEALLAQLGKHRMGKGCLYIKRLSDVDMSVLQTLVERSVETLRKTYPQ